MLPDERFKLLFGPYAAPRCKVGGTLKCLARGKVVVRGISDAIIPWPFTRNPNGAGRPVLILCGDLARAVRKESEVAVCHWWGVCATTVWKWRLALGITHTVGTSKLRSRLAPDTVQSDLAIERQRPSLKTAARAEKIAAAKRGKPRPQHVLDALAKANIGRRLSRAQRQKMSESHKRRGTRPPAAGVPWTAEEEALLGTMLDREVAQKTGRTLVAVQCRRAALEIDSFRSRSRK